MKNVVKMALLIMAVAATACHGRNGRGTMDSTATFRKDTTSSTVDTLAHQDTAKGSTPAKKDTTQKK